MHLATRQHTSWMHTVRLESVCASLSVATTRCQSVGVGSQMNKFDQWSPPNVLRSDVQKGGYPTTWPIPRCIRWDLSPSGKIDACENINFPFELLLLAVMKRFITNQKTASPHYFLTKVPSSSKDGTSKALLAEVTPGDTTRNEILETSCRFHRFFELQVINVWTR